MTLPTCPVAPTIPIRMGLRLPAGSRWTGAGFPPLTARPQHRAARGRWDAVALWNLYQEIEITNLRAKQAGAEAAHAGRMESVQDQVWRLEDRIERLLLITDALWELASGPLGLTDEQLAAKVHELDAESGQVDGRRARTASRCGSCGAAIQLGRATCVFCGAAAPVAPSPLDQV